MKHNMPRDKGYFLAPPWAQGVKTSGCPAQTYLHIALRSVSLRALKALLEYFICKSEPIILCLVYLLLTVLAVTKSRNEVSRMLQLWIALHLRIETERGMRISDLRKSTQLWWKRRAWLHLNTDRKICIKIEKRKVGVDGSFHKGIQFWLHDVGICLAWISKSRDGVMVYNNFFPSFWRFGFWY